MHGTHNNHSIDLSRVYRTLSMKRSVGPSMWQTPSTVAVCLVSAAVASAHCWTCAGSHCSAMVTLCGGHKALIAMYERVVRTSLNTNTV